MEQENFPPFPKQKFRELVFQFLFAFEMGDSNETETIKLLMRELAIAKSHIKQAYAYAQLVWTHLSMLDQNISLRCKDYAFARIQPVEKSILRLACYEIILEKKEPFRVLIAEALRLTRKFSSEEAMAFVNAILDTCKNDAIEDPIIELSQSPCVCE